jgi:hypothetical protein
MERTRKNSLRVTLFWSWAAAAALPPAKRSRGFLNNSCRVPANICIGHPAFKESIHKFNLCSFAAKKKKNTKILSYFKGVTKRIR